MKFKHEIKANYGEAEQMSPLITRVLCNNPSPYTYTGTGTYLVGAGEGLAVIDPGPLVLQHGSAILQAAAGRTITKILVTHSHSDHSPLARWLADQTGAVILGFGAHGMGRRGGLEGEDVEMGADYRYAPDTCLKDGVEISGPDWSITAVHTPGHTANHMCFHLKEENTLFVGDHIMGWATTVIAPPDGDMRQYLASLKKVAERNPEILAPTHGPWVTDPLPFIRGIITHRRMREGQILKHLEQGPTSIENMVPKMYKGVDKRLYPAAARSVLGHMIALVDEARVACDGPPRLSSNFRLAERE